MATPVKVRPLGNSSCAYHSDKEVIYFCEDCPKGTLACPECVTTRHRTHRLEKLANIIPWKKEQVLRYIDATESQNLPSIQNDIATLDIRLLENKTTFHDLILDMKIHANQWKSNIDKYVEMNVQNFLDIEKENTEILLKHKRKLLNDSSEIKDTLVNHRNTLQCGNPVQIFDIKISHHVKLTFPGTKTAKFKRREFSQESLPHVFGSVIIENAISHEKKSATPPQENVSSTFLKPQQNPRLVRRNSTGRIKEIPVAKKSEQKQTGLKVEQNSKRVRRNSFTEQVQLIKPVNKAELKPTTKKISNIRRHSTSTSIGNEHTSDLKQSSDCRDNKGQGSVKVQGHFEHQSLNGGYTLVSPVQLVMFESPYGSVDFISPTKDDQAWVCKYNETSVRLLDLMGDLQEEVVSPSGITGVSVAPDTCNLWLSCLDRGIREIVKQKPKTSQTKRRSDGNISVSSHHPNLMHRRTSADSSMKGKTSQNSKRIQHQMSEDFCKSPESNAGQRKSSFNSSMSECALQKHKFGLNDLKPNFSKRRKSITKSLNEVEARLAEIGKCVESNPHNNEYSYFRNKTPVLPSINIIPPDSNSSIVCIFDNNEEALPQNKPCKKSLATSGQPTSVHHKQNQESPQSSLEQQTGKKLRVNGRAVVRFYVDDTPWSLCVTKDNNILIGIANTIIIYTTWGQVQRQVNKESWFTYTTPRVTSLQQMVQCPVSCNIAVMGQSHQGTHHVFIMDSALNLISSYTGEKDSGDKMSAISTSPFSAAALCYDSVGHLVVADSNNRSIVLISGTGVYLKTLHQDTWATQAVGIQEDNTLWAAFKLYSNVEVKLFKYTE